MISHITRTENKHPSRGRSRSLLLVAHCSHTDLTQDKLRCWNASKKHKSSHRHRRSTSSSRASTPVKAEVVACWACSSQALPGKMNCTSWHNAAPFSLQGSEHTATARFRLDEDSGSHSLESDSKPESHAFDFSLPW